MATINLFDYENDHLLQPYSQSLKKPGICHNIIIESTLVKNVNFTESCCTVLACINCFEAELKISRKIHRLM